VSGKQIKCAGIPVVLFSCLFVFFVVQKIFSSSILLIHVHFKFQATPRLAKRARLIPGGGSLRHPEDVPVGGFYAPVERTQMTSAGHQRGRILSSLDGESVMLGRR
ncbi:uncharacterized protein METZ01_LOCUS355263, partial [marine metagenome]